MIAAEGSKGTTEKEKPPTHRVGGELIFSGLRLHKPCEIRPLFNAERPNITD